MAESQHKSKDTDINSSSSEMAGQSERHYKCLFQSTKPWFDLQYHNDKIKKPDELENDMEDPPGDFDKKILNRIQGSMIGMALGDALGAHVEFRPHSYMVENRVEKLEGGGTWGLKAGQFTDDTSMALCLANSLVARKGYVPYDQLVRYKWWYKKGYMSSTGLCFDIGAATKNALDEFEHRQEGFGKKHDISTDDLDYLLDRKLLEEFKVSCSEDGVAGNGALMRLAPIPLFFYRDPATAVEYSGQSGHITHGDKKAYDACRYYGALIVAAIHGASRAELLDKEFYVKHKHWFGKTALAPEIMDIAEGSYQRKNGYDDGIRGKGYIVSALEAALWAFWSHRRSFEDGALAAVNLGDDTDTTAAIYGQLAGAYYGYRKLLKDWRQKVYAYRFLKCLSKWIVYEGERWSRKQPPASSKSTTKFNSASGKNQNKTTKLPKEDIDAESVSSDSEASLVTLPKTRERRNTCAAHPISRLKEESYPENDRPLSAERHASNKTTRDSSYKPWDPAVALYYKLEELGEDYAEYIDLFKKRILKHYEFSDITEEILQERGIKDEEQRQIIFQQIKKLQRKSETKPVPDQETTD